jgi:hypothetical protein
MLCRVDGLRVWADALPPGVSSRCVAAIISYNFTSLLATIGLSSYVLGSVSWGYQWRVPLVFLAFSFVLWTSLVIHGLLANPCIGYFAVLSALLLNEKRVKSRSRKKKDLIKVVYKEAQMIDI